MRARWIWYFIVPRVVYVGDTGPNKNVSIAVETDKRLSDIYYVSDAPVDHIGESAYMCLQPGKLVTKYGIAGAVANYIFCAAPADLLNPANICSPRIDVESKKVGKRSTCRLRRFHVI